MKFWTLIRAEKAIGAWARRLERHIEGVAILAGLHTDTGRVHGHALLYVPNRGISQRPGPWTTLARIWQQHFWRHGLLWLAEYRPFHVPRSANPHTHGAPLYLAKDVGTVSRFGRPVPYQPKRTRR